MHAKTDKIVEVLSSCRSLRSQLCKELVYLRALVPHDCHDHLPLRQALEWFLVGEQLVDDDAEAVAIDLVRVARSYTAYDDK